MMVSNCKINHFRNPERRRVCSRKIQQRRRTVMSHEVEIRDNWGRRIGTGKIRAVDDSWACCLTTILCIAGVIGLIIYGISSLIGRVQSQQLPLHNSLKNIQITGESNPGCYSDSSGYHVVNTVCSYSDVKYDDVDISLTVELSSDSSSGSTEYGFIFRSADVQGTPEYYQFALLPNGRVFYASSFGMEAFNSGHDPSGISSEAIKKGIGATNTLEVRTQGSHFKFFINGTNVGEQNDSSMPSSGSIAFFADNYAPIRDLPNVSIEAVFTNLVITKDTQ